MLVGTKYAAAPPTGRYDAIVIGSGLAGLSAASVLARAGKRVLVLERHYTAGGFTHSYRRRGYTWDVGVHYVGEVHKPGSTLRRVFDTITDGQLQWAQMPDTYDRIVMPDASYDFVAGASAFREELLRSFPSARGELDAYLRLLRANGRAVAAEFGPRFLPGPLDPVLGGVARRATGSQFTRTTASVLGGVVSDPKLAGVLTGQWGDYGLPPGRSAFGMHAVVAQHYLGGAAFPVGGAWRIADSIVPGIERAGGAVLVNAEVGQILVVRGRAIGVRMTNGDEILADHVISDAGLQNTYGRLLPEGAGDRVRRKAAALTPSVGHLGLTVGLKGTTAELGLQGTNLWVYPGYDHDANMRAYKADPDAPFPLQYLSFPSAKDPQWETANPGRSTIDVISTVPYDRFAEWKGTPWRKRGAAYEDLKAGLSERLLAELYRQVPGARGRVDVAELSTPLSTMEFNSTPNGGLYGLEHSPDRFSQTWISPRTPIKGLRLTGQDTLFCGVASAALSGVLTASAVLGPRSVPLLAEVFGRRR
jgi:all-trans-retinol 13,14-reductase